MDDAHDVVHAVDHRQFGVGFGGFQRPRIANADLHVVAALDDQRRHLQLREGFRGILAEQRNQVRLHARTENHLQRLRHIVVSLAGLEAVEQFIAA
ncbi:hypothetical protein D3C81_1420930 [compost metagenome]